MNISNIKDKFDRGESLEYLFFWSHRPNPDGAVGKTCGSTELAMQVQLLKCHDNMLLI